MSDDNDDEKRPTPQRLIYEAHERAAEERERVSAAPLLDDRVLDTQLAEVEYHAAVMEYWNRLKPHLPYRKKYWEEVPLWTEPMEGRRAALAREIAEYYGVETSDAAELLDKLEADDESYEEFQPRDGATVHGLKHLVHWRDRVEEDTITEKDVINGEVRQTVQKPIHLPRQVAMRVHDLLDEAAADLGYNTRPGKDIPTTHLSGDASTYEVTGVVNDG